MSDHPDHIRNRDTLVENFAAELTSAFDKFCAKTAPANR